MLWGDGMANTSDDKASVESGARDAAAEGDHSVFSGAVAALNHEFRTPLMTISSVLQLISRMGVDPHQQRLIDSAGRAARQLEFWIDNIHASINEGCSDLHDDTPRPTNLLKEIEDVAHSLKVAFLEKGMSQSMSVEGDLAALRMVDVKPVRHLIYNLFDAFVKLADGGEMAVTIDATHADSVRIAIGDSRGRWSSGARHVVDRVFDHDVDTLMRRDGGAALGVRVALTLAQRLAADLTIRDGADGAVTFDLTLSAPLAFERTTRAPHTPMTVLVVDDNDVNQRLISAMINGLGHTALAATSGEHALDVLDTSQVDLILMDVHMPGMNGYETTQSIRGRSDQHAHAPIVALTADAEASVESAARNAGMNAVLKNPIEIAQIAGALLRYSTPRA